MEKLFVDRKDRFFGTCIVLSLALLLASPAIGVPVICGEPIVYLFSEPEPVDIDCETGNMYAFDSTVNLLTGGHFSDAVGGAGGGKLSGVGASVINIYGGAIDTSLSYESTVLVTVYAASVEPIPGILEAGQTEILNTSASTLNFDLVGTYEDGTPFSLPIELEANARLNLNIQQTAPEIEVLPALLEWDFGDVEVGQSATVLVQIFNQGTADLTVSDVTLTGDPDISITSGPATPLVIAPDTSIGVDFEITYTPSDEGFDTAVVEIVSDDADEPNVLVDLLGNGIIVEIPPSQQIQDILDYFEEAVAQGTIQGYGPGNSSRIRLWVLHKMIKSTGTLIDIGCYHRAYWQLWAIEKKTDGQRRPQDFVVGEGVADLNAMIIALMEDLQEL